MILKNHIKSRSTAPPALSRAHGLPPWRAQSRALTLVITAAVIVFIGLLVGVAGLLFPPVIFFAGLLLFIGIVVGFSAIIPLVQVWQFNRQQRT